MDSLHAYIVTACMQELGLDTLDGNPKVNIPLTYKKKEQYDWLMKIARGILNKHVNETSRGIDTCN